MIRSIGININVVIVRIKKGCLYISSGRTCDASVQRTPGITREGEDPNSVLRKRGGRSV